MIVVYRNYRGLDFLTWTERSWIGRPGSDLDQKTFNGVIYLEARRRDEHVLGAERRRLDGLHPLNVDVQ